MSISVKKIDILSDNNIVVAKMTQTTSKYAVDRKDLTLGARLVRAMRDAILSGDLKPGRQLPERELCEMFDVSRSLVREATQMLAAEELVTIIPHRGVVVTLLNRHDARSLYRVRAALEGLACAEFTRNALDSDRDDLRECLAQIEQLGESDASDTLVAAKNNFYRCLLEGSKNPILAQMLTQLNNRIVQLRRLSLSQSGRLPQTKREIRAIVEAILAGDADAARKMAEDHVVKAAIVADERFAELTHHTKAMRGTE